MARVKDKSLYNLLGVPSGAEPHEIKAGYRKRAAATHPDVGGDTDEFVRVREAYDVLSDEARRREYDHTGKWDRRLVQDSRSRMQTFLAELFSMAIGEGIAFDERQPLMEMMRSTAEKQRGEMAAMVEGVTALIANLRGLRERIYRPDDGRNTFVAMTDTRILMEEKKLAAMTAQRDTANDAVRELMLYESVDDVVRHAVFWGAGTATTTGTAGGF